ncbi:amidase [Paracoccus sp. Z330]|uniref:Amidase n=1 Tax=Paracoccus onchidii TaxID=3017813 RepID=A0ABT4ZGH0_9RHOB|nr:amidase [Paracoccus onchidii]MDB6178466.1 amidase [Paracoccus onchidii]
MSDNQRAEIASGHQPSEIVIWNALELSRHIHDRAVSCHEVMAAYLDHIEACNPSVNAIISLRDRAALFGDADRCDDELGRGMSRGWLHGVPQAIKDLSATAGLKTTLGSPIFAEQVPEHDSIVASRMKRDGAIVIGKTNVPEFGLGSHTYNPVFGITRNPYDTRLSAGGSSGGAAAALAMRMLPVADGSDMMGSLRNPAAWNNVYGLRPSFGRVPFGVAPEVFGHQLATEGPMARTVGDLARLLATQAGPDPRVPLSNNQDPAIFASGLERDMKGIRIAWMGDWHGYLPMENSVLSLCEQALESFRTIGCDVEEALPAFDPSELWQCWLDLRHWGVAGLLAPLYEDPEKRKLLKPEARWEIEGGLRLSALDIHRANTTRSAWYAALGTLLQEYDAVALPSAQLFPFAAEECWPREIAGRRMDSYHRWMEVVIPGSLSGNPVISLPAGFNHTGLPMGIQLIGRHQADLEILQIAHAYEQAAPESTRRTPRFSGN